MDERNHVGICHMDVVDVQDVLTMPEEWDGELQTPVVLKAGASWSRVYFEDNGGRFTEKWQLQNGAQYAASRISGALVKDSLPTMRQLWKAQANRYLVLFATRNGDRLLMGSVLTPAILLAGERTTGEDASADRNQYEAAFSLSARLPVPYYLPAAPPLVPSNCPTLAQLLPLATIGEIVGAATSTQLEDLSTYFGANCPTMAQLIAAATDTALYAALSDDQAIYIANQAISIIDGGDATSTPGPVVDPGGSELPTDPLGPGYGAGYDPSGYQTT